MEVIRINSSEGVALKPQALLDLAAGQLLTGVPVTIRQGRIQAIGSSCETKGSSFRDVQEGITQIFSGGTGGTGKDLPVYIILPES
ncbi:MAG: hypothetical protein GX750_04095 [Clostridia bacterium]|nr:hypothetical protein [Clostridia bacterium]